MRIVAVMLAGAALQAGSAHASPTTPAEYSLAVKHICAGALLFGRSHRIGTRAGAVAVSRDIRVTGGRRLRRVDAVPKPPGTAPLAARWVAIEQRLVATYATTYLQIWDTIESAYSSRRKHAQLADVMYALVHRPDALQRRAAALGQRLGVPDCTGGQANPADRAP
jgi:hypothetical protein